MKEETKKCTCNNDNRYCKGCYADVTKTMFCHCGEFSLNREDTLSEQEMIDKERYDRDNHIYRVMSPIKQSKRIK